MPLNDPFFNDLEASACYGDGAIEPSQILIPQIDADALDEYARDLRRAGKNIGTDGNDIVADWGGLGDAYVAPESETMLSAVDRVATDGDTVETGTGGLAAALIDFANEVRTFKSKLHGLRGDATAMRTRINEDEDWRDDEDLVQEHNDLVDEVARTRQEWEEAEIACANEITALFDGPTFTRYDEMEGDGYSGNEIPYGFSEIPEGMEMPWGTAQNVSRGFVVDAWDGVADIVVGAAQDVGGVTGAWHDGKWGMPIFGEQGRSNFTGYMEENLEGLSLLTGFYDPTKPEGEQWGVDSFGEWTDNFLPAIREVGQGIVPTDEWDERKGYVVSQTVVNVGLIVGGVVLSATGVGAPVGVPMLLAGLRTGLRATNNVGTMDIPRFHDDADFHLPGVPHLNLSRGGGGGGGGFWSSLPGGAWLADLVRTRDALDGIGDGGSTTPNTSADRSPSPTRPQDDTDGASSDRSRSEDEEIDSGVSASEVETGLRDLEDYVRRHAEDPDMLLEEINRRQGNEIVDAHRTPELVGAGNGPSASSDSTFTNSAGGGGGGGIDTPTTGRGGTTESSSDGGNSGGGSHSGEGNGQGNTGSGTSPYNHYGTSNDHPRTIPEDYRAMDKEDIKYAETPYGTLPTNEIKPVSSWDTSRSNPKDFPEKIVSPNTNKDLWPQKSGLFGRGVDLDPNTRYEIKEGNGRPAATYFTDDTGRITEVHTKSGKTRNWNPELSDPLPNAKYFVDEFTYITDNKGRTAYMEGDITKNGNIRGRDESNIGHISRLEYDLANQISRMQFAHDPSMRYRTEYEQVTWNGGHLAAREHGGGAEKINLVGMPEEMNKYKGTDEKRDRSWRAMEMEISEVLSANPGKRVKLQIECVYSESNIISDTPLKILVQYTSPTGRVRRLTFGNTPPHTIIGRQP
ncbi:DNA/RNA non-specific endonuclease [Nocardiopsis sp. NPDC055879]